MGKHNGIEDPKFRVKSTYDRIVIESYPSGKKVTTYVANRLEGGYKYTHLSEFTELIEIARENGCQNLEFQLNGELELGINLED